MAKTEKIDTNCYGIVVVLDLVNGGGTISSDLADEYEGIALIAALHAIESMVLGHACAGVDIKSPAYIEGIEVAVEACENKLSEDVV